jgi:hypothetical protein
MVPVTPLCCADAMASDELTPAQRRLRAQIAAHASWAHTEDRAARTAAARQAAHDRFERQVDPEGVLPPGERARRAESARKAYFLSLALRSAKSRNRRNRPRS